MDSAASSGCAVWLWFRVELGPRQAVLTAAGGAVSSEAAPGGPPESSAARGSCRHLSGDQEEYPGVSSQHTAAHRCSSLQLSS